MENGNWAGCCTLNEGGGGGAKKEPPVPKPPRAAVAELEGNAAEDQPEQELAPGGRRSRKQE
jgi:hypothetical protein